MRKKLLWIMLAIPILAIALMADVSAPTYDPMVSVDPQVIWDPTMDIGTQFTVDIVADDFENLWAYQFWLTFDPGVLHGVKIENSPFLGSLLPPKPPFPFEVRVSHDEDEDGDVDEYDEYLSGYTWKQWNNTGGYSNLFGAAIYFPMDPPIPPQLPDGGGVLATVTFEVVGYGCTPITLGPETALLGTTHPPPYPAEYYWMFYGGDPENGWDDEGKPGFFANVPGPELEMPHGVSGVWEEYQTILVGEPQTQYCRVRNWGELEAYVRVDFIIRGPGGIVIRQSNEVLVGARAPDGTPGDVTVSADYIPGPPGKYYVSAVIYFKAGCMTEMAPYYLVEGTLGGESTTRDLNVAYTVKTHM